MIFLGDSITQQWESAGREVWEKHYAPRRAVNFGISGDRTQHLLWRVQNGNLDGLANPLRGSPPKLVVILIGTNNLADDSPEQVVHGIEAVVKAVRQKLPQTPALLLTIFPRGEQPWHPMRKPIRTIGSAVEEAFATTSEVVVQDLRSEFLPAPPEDAALPAFAELKQLLSPESSAEISAAVGLEFGLCDGSTKVPVRRRAVKDQNGMYSANLVSSAQGEATIFTRQTLASPGEIVFWLTNPAGDLSGTLAGSDHAVNRVDDSVHSESFEAVKRFWLRKVLQERLAPEVMPDFLHLSTKGYEMWASAMEPKVRELLGETKPADNPND